MAKNKIKHLSRKRGNSCLICFEVCASGRAVMLAFTNGGRSALI